MTLSAADRAGLAALGRRLQLDAESRADRVVAANYATLTAHAEADELDPADLLLAESVLDTAASLCSVAADEATARRIGRLLTRVRALTDSAG